MMSTEESNFAAAKKKLRAIQSFKKRKACILKKTMELSVLCDVEASAIVVEDNGVVSTWPENRCDVMNIINKYKAWRLDEKNKKSSELQQQRNEGVSSVRSTAEFYGANSNYNSSLYGAKSNADDWNGTRSWFLWGWNGTRSWFLWGRRRRNDDANATDWDDDANTWLLWNWRRRRRGRVNFFWFWL
ncbi:hypothetical protein M9H77_05204 [Catharanthus roseus]|uniref:Uncharacterized protein n=1 Tax=Catharanthus roseus TaxID=4058 RepID=A0ACC0CG91_CATRO|nr:hypothetical protein M9H77_05204 [Catharanthus roseus]